MLSSRISRLEEWISHSTAVLDGNRVSDTRIHGEIAGLGAWTGRMAHSKPNLGNIPAFNQTEPDKTPYSDKMRGLWRAGPGMVLVGVDAEGIQLRILAHYMKDQNFIDALVHGRKEDGTDPHALNKSALGKVCRSRDDAKTWIYAWLLGAGKRKQAAILGCSVAEATRAEQNLLDKYRGLRYIKEKVLPRDAVRGYFEGLDGRYVPIPGDTPDERLHLALAGYLQNGEAIVIKRACLKFLEELRRKKISFELVNIVHDEYLIECYDKDSREIKQILCTAVEQVGEDLGLECPLSGTGKIGRTWYDVH